MPRQENCTKCPLHLTASHICQWGVGPKHADIMLLGEAPYDDGSQPFSGDAGRILNEALADVGLGRGDVYISNINKCRPPASRQPTSSELSACTPYLIEEINSVKPKVIICLGGNALKALTGKDSIKDARGKPCETVKNIRVGDAQVLATYHPAAFLHRRDKALLSALREDLKLASQMAGLSTTKLPKDEKTYILPWYDATALIEALTELKDCKRVAVDCEWSAGQDIDDGIRWPWTPDTEMYSLSISGRTDKGVIKSVAVAWPPCSEQTAKGNEALARRALQAFLSKRQLVFHNAMADLIWLIAEGFDLSPTDDTQFLGYLLNEEQRLNLDRLAALYAGIPPWKNGLWSRRPITRPGWEELLKYNSDDTYATLLLLEAEMRIIKERPLEEQKNLGRAYRHLLVPAIRAFVEMALNGIPVNHKALKQAIIEHKAKRDGYIDQLAEDTGMRPHQARSLIKSPVQLKKYFKLVYGLEVPDVQAETLEAYGDQYPLIALVAAEKHEEKLLSTYLEPWDRMLTRQGDGRLHFVYRLDRTRTGRTTASSEEGGSVQLAPREEWLRALFEARPGFKIVAPDQSQIEIRVVGWLAPEPTIRKLYQEGADIHLGTAIKVNRAAAVKTGAHLADKLGQAAPTGFAETERLLLSHKPLRKEYPEWDLGRQNAKGINFGFLYGMQAEKFVRYAKKTYGVVFTPSQAVEMRKAYFEAYPALLAWHSRMEQMSRNGESIVMPFGRYRRGATDATQYINTPIQTTGNDLSIFTLGETRLYNRIKEEFGDACLFVGFIHDSIMLEVQDDCIDRVKEIVKYEMEHPPVESIGMEPIPVPLVADFAIGQKWTK